jgi:dipeptide/tripeptide permease
VAALPRFAHSSGRLYLIGCILLLVTSLPVALERGAGVPGLGVAMVFIGLGAGCVKATYFPFLGMFMPWGERRACR